MWKGNIDASVEDRLRLKKLRVGIAESASGEFQRDRKDIENLMDTLRNIAKNLYEGDQDAVTNLVQNALRTDLPAGEILTKGLMVGMDKVGVDFKAGILYTPEVLVAARAMHAGLEVLRPLLADGEIAGAGRCLIGTVKGDLHDIGKNLVVMMLEGAGFEVLDLGVDVHSEAFVAAVRNFKPDILGMSALLTTTMPQMKTVIDDLEASGLRDSLGIMVGGAPLTEAYADEIGADAYAEDGAEAVEVARRLVC